MRAIHISNDRKRDAEVAFGSEPPPRPVRTVLPGGAEKRNVKILKSTVSIDEDALNTKYGEPAKIAQALVDSDPEIDMEAVGKKLSRTHKLWVRQDNKIAYSLSLYQVAYNPDGTEKERHDLNKVPGNVNSKIPLKWTGKMFPKEEIVRRFVFVRRYQIHHINGATFDFLYKMAKDLHESGSMVLVGAGNNGTDPILLSRGGQPYRGFLEGRIEKDERYALILHLSDIELRGPSGEA